MNLYTDDVVPAALGILGIIAYVGLVTFGYVDFQFGVVESLLAIVLAALGYDTYTDSIRARADEVAEIADLVTDVDVPEDPNEWEREDFVAVYNELSDDAEDTIDEFTS